MNEFLQKAKEILNWGIHIGEGEKGIHLTLGLLLMLLLAIFATGIVLKFIRRLVTRKMDRDDSIKFFSLFQFIKYAIYLIVVLITLSAAGVNITLLITASAALFVGLGLALQELFQDIIAGFYIIVDKSLNVGDIIEMEGKIGRVQEIKLRTTRALTRDDKIIIIPNHKFISDIIYNYTQNYDTTREFVQVGVSYGSDVEQVTQVLLKCLEGVDGILREPKPFVLFDDFADSALLFSIHFFVVDSFAVPAIKSKVRYQIDAEFRLKNITIPFPQRDIHFYDHSKPNP